MLRQSFVATSLFAAVLLVVIALMPPRRGPNPIRTTIESAIRMESSNDRPLTLIGDVQRSSRHYDGYAQWRFVLEDGGDVMPVRYHGIVPSTFEEGARVQVIGRMEGNTFVATGLAVRM